MQKAARSFDRRMLSSDVLLSFAALGQEGYPYFPRARLACHDLMFMARTCVDNPVFLDLTLGVFYRIGGCRAEPVLFAMVSFSVCKAEPFDVREILERLECLAFHEKLCCLLLGSSEHVAELKQVRSGQVIHPYEIPKLAPSLTATDGDLAFIS